MDLLTKAKEHVAGARAAAAAELVQIALHRDNPRAGDAERLIELADYFGRQLEQLPDDLELIARADALRQEARRLPELAPAAAECQTTEKLIRHKYSLSIEAADRNRNQAQAELKRRLGAARAAFERGRVAEAELTAMLPRLAEIFGSYEAIASFRKLYDSCAIGEAFATATNKLRAELAGQPLRDGTLCPRPI